MTRLIFVLSVAVTIAIAAWSAANAQVGPLPPTITAQPQAATVGFGAGVSFSVSARAAPRDFITGYRWRRGTTILVTGPNSSYAIPVVDATHAGDYSVEVLSLSGSTLSAVARLTVVSAAWAQLGGRAVSLDVNAQQPALSLCDGPKLAWIQTNAAGIDELRVSRFIGTGWAPLGGVLNVSATAHAAEPSIDCSDWLPGNAPGQKPEANVAGPQRPVVAWSEGAGNARTIRVKAWNGTAWVEVLRNLTDSISSVGANARKPVLRVAPFDPHWHSLAHIRALSALTWNEGGTARAKFWNGQDWQIYTGGHPGGTVLGEPAWIHDTRHVSGGFADLPPLLAHVTPLGPVALGNTTMALRVNSTGAWTAVGQAPAPAGRISAPLRLAGIGFGTQTIGDGVVAIWASHDNGTFTIESSQLFGPDYVNALRSPLNPPPAWGMHARPATGFDLTTLAMDPRALVSQCPTFDRRVSFAIAISDFEGTRVLRSVCTGSVTAPMDWNRVGTDMPRGAAALSLKMESETTPVLAEAQPVNGGSRLSVWRFYP